VPYSAHISFDFHSGNNMFLRFQIKFLYNADSYFCIDMDCCICLSFGHSKVYYSWITYRALIAFNTHSQICSRYTAVNTGYICSEFETVWDLPELCCNHRSCFMNWWQCCWITCLLLCLLSTPQETPNPSYVVAGTVEPTVYVIHSRYLRLLWRSL
jgi:hypothetical protein